MLKPKDKEMQKIMEYVKEIEKEHNADRLQQWIENIPKENPAKAPPSDKLNHDE